MKRRSRYSFCYSINGIFTELPTHLSVLAYSLDEATTLAHVEFARVLKHEARPYWEGTPDAAGVVTWTRVTPPPYTGKLYEPGQLVQRRKRWSKKRWAKHRESMDGLAKTMGHKDAEALGSFLSAPILQVIEKAPVISELFSKPLPEVDTPTIPLCYRIYSRRRPQQP